MLKKKIVVDEEGVVHYTHLNPKFGMTIEQSDERGWTWCSNCYKDHKPIMVVYIDNIDILNLCLDCIQLIFSFKKEERGT